MTSISTQDRNTEFAKMNASLDEGTFERAADRAIGAGYRLQMTLIDLIDLTLQIQHLRWNLFDEPELRTQLTDLDALVRAGSEAVAQRLSDLGVAPDGTVGAVYRDLLFEPLPSGPFDAQSAANAFAPRLSQLDHRLEGSVAILADLDSVSVDIITTIANDVAAWSLHLSTAS
jgi:starvation-inducible DNA-binding protein